MLHSGILPHHPKWAKLFENLRFVVIDELHAYRGVFGSHLANVLRRLQRICRHYGSDPVFICSSATIANPRELAERLAERPFALVDDNGAPRGEKLFLFVNPPVVNKELGIRRSYLSEARRVAGEFLKRQLQLIVFCQSRLSTEILTTYLKDDFEGPPGTPEQVRGYRGGYLPLRRREIERGLREGQVRAVVATNALELGIDIGALDIAVMAGYPGTIASTWQRAGRAGRRQGRSAAVMVGQQRADRPVRRPQPVVFLRRLARACAGQSRQPAHPARSREVRRVRAAVRRGRKASAANRCRRSCSCSPRKGFVHLVEDGCKPRAVELDERVVSRRRGQPALDLVGQLRGRRHDARRRHHRRDRLHQRRCRRCTRRRSTSIEGRLFQVERLDFEGRKAFVRRVDCDYYTDAITYSRVTILDVFQTESAAVSAESSVGPNFSSGKTPDDAEVSARAALRSHGDVRVVSRVVGFKKIKFYTNENVGSGELDLPEQQMHTTSYWLTLPRALMARLPYSLEDRRDGVAGLAFAMVQVAQLLLMCDRHDIGISIGSGDERTQRSVDGDARRRRISRSRGSSSTITIRAASASASRCLACTTSWSPKRAS